MKLLKKYLLLSLVAPLLFSLLSFKGSGKDGLVIIRVFETDKGCMGSYQSKILITEDGKSREIELDKHEYRKTSVADNIISEKIYSVLKQYKLDGYKIESSVAGSEVTCQSVTTYILTK